MNIMLIGHYGYHKIEDDLFIKQLISCPVTSFVYNRGGRKIITRSDIATQCYRER